MDTLPSFLKDKLHERTSANGNPLAYALVSQALSDVTSQVPLSERLAAAFDLIVASKFYQYVEPEEWIWCGYSSKDFYPILNACPSCVLSNRFVHTSGHKPSSGQIGPATALAFREIVAAYFDLTGKEDCFVCDASEPIDLAVIDKRSQTLFIAEVKAAPLFTPPLVRQHSITSIQTQRTLPLNHSLGVARGLHEAPVALFIPGVDSTMEIYIEAGVVGKDKPLDRSLAAVITNDPKIAPSFFRTWSAMWRAYQEKDTTTLLYWFCGACGRPNNPGEGWPREANGRPKGSISDGKTSVGIDRTDDIKKATFQALKLGVENRRKDSSPWRLLIGLASNLHASRHYDGYLQPYEDIMWGWADTREEARTLYNLFDGIVSFTRSHMRDEWLQNTLDWHGTRHV
jgi:hypothetical protein